jgi:hypothetical protein
MISDVESFCLYLLAFCMPFFEKCLFRYFALLMDCFPAIELFEFLINFGS